MTTIIVSRPLFLDLAGYSWVRVPVWYCIQKRPDPSCDGRGRVAKRPQNGQQA